MFTFKQTFRAFLGFFLFALLWPKVASPQARLSTTDVQYTGTQRFSDDGRYFCAMTQTPGTAYNLSGATQNAFLATQAIWTINNTASATTSGVRIHPDRAFISFATAGTGGTRAELAIAIDDVSRYSSGGTAQVVKNSNMRSTIATVATVFGGDITAAAAGANVRYVARATISASAQAVGQVYGISWGGSYIGTAEGARIVAVPSVAIGPGDTLVIHMWFPGLSAQPTGELNICWFEK